MKTFALMRSQLNDKSSTGWIDIGQRIKARSEKEANSKMVRKFKNCGFHSMGLAVKEFK